MFGDGTEIWILEKAGIGRCDSDRVITSAQPWLVGSASTTLEKALLASARERTVPAVQVCVAPPVVKQLVS